jgi:RHS repeat-associated protein
VKRTRGGASTSFLYGSPEDEFTVTASVDAAGLRTTYFYDEMGHLHGLERGGARYRVGTDQVGSPRVVMDGAGAVVLRVDRDTFGRRLAVSNPAFDLPIGYAGGIEDPDTGLVRFGLRDYDPQTGRFTSRDPSFYSGSPRNLYAYADNAPSHRMDPTGLDSWGISSYALVGGGFQYVDGGDGTYALCFEMGFGLGMSAEYDAFAKPEAGQSRVSEVSAAITAGEPGAWGSVGGSMGMETSLGDTYDPCYTPKTVDELWESTKYTGKITAAAGSGPVNISTSVVADSASGFDATGSVSPDLSKTPLDIGIEGKAANKDCIKMKGSFWNIFN